MVEGTLWSVLQRRLVHRAQRTYARRPHYYFEINLRFIFVGGCTGYVRFGQMKVGLRKYRCLDMQQTSVATRLSAYYQLIQIIIIIITDYRCSADYCMH